MKLRKTLLSFACAIMVALSFTACGDDWGRQDDPAGGQIYPSKSTVATYDFEYSEEKPEYSDMISHDESCEVTNDETLASNVLHINGKGGAKIANPFNGVKLQNGAAITFAVKIDAAVAEDGTVADVDLTRPLISFGSDEKDAAGNDISAHFYITANGQVVYNKPTQLQSLNLNENDPASVKTGILSPNEWHFVALQLSTEGYQLYVDGKKSLSGYQTSSSATSFQYKTLVDSINSLPYIYIGGDSKLTAEETNTVSIDNVTLIRNMMEEKDWNKTIGGNGGNGGDMDAPFNTTLFLKGYYLPAGSTSLSNGVTGGNDASLVIDEAQTTPSGFEKDDERGMVWHQQEGYAGHDNGKSHLDFDNPLVGTDLSNGATISFWVKQPSINWWDTIFGMTDGTAHFWFNGNGYLGFNDGVGMWFDCHNNNADNALVANTWTFVSIVVKNDGFTVYYDGTEKFSSASNAAWNSSGDIDYSKMLTFLSTCSKASLGYGSFWGSANSYVSDLSFLSHAASAAEVSYLMFLGNRTPKALYLMKSNFVNVFNPSQVGSKIEIESQATASNFESDANRGMVWHQQEGWVGHANGLARVELDNPLVGANLSNGATISFWAKQPAVNWWDSIWGMTDNTTHFWFNGNGYLGFNNGSGIWFDCHNNNNTNALPDDVWTQVTMVFTSTGFTVYYNGDEKFSNTSNGAWADSGSVDFNQVLNFLKTFGKMNFGYGSFWGCANTFISDVFVYGSAMDAEQVKLNYRGTVR